MSLGEVLLKTDRLAVLGDGLVQVSPGVQRVAKVVVDPGVVPVEAESYTLSRGIFC